MYFTSINTLASFLYNMYFNNERFISMVNVTARSIKVGKDIV